VAKGTSFGSAIYLKSGELSPVRFGSYPGRVIAAEITQLGLLLISIHAPIDEYGYIMPHLLPIFDGVKEVTRGKKFIVGGDLNSARLWDEVGGTSYHTEFFQGLEDSGFYDCVWNTCGQEIQTFYGKKASYPFQLDHLFIDELLKNRLESCEVLEYKEPLSSYSDHVPVVIEIENFN
jgi:exonuclease III